MEEEILLARWAVVFVVLGSALPCGIRDMPLHTPFSATAYPFFPLFALASRTRGKNNSVGEHAYFYAGKKARYRKEWEIHIYLRQPYFPPTCRCHRLPERALLIASKEKYMFMFPFPTFSLLFSQPGENVWAGLEEEERRERVEAIKSNHGHRSETEREGERSEGPSPGIGYTKLYGAFFLLYCVLHTFSSPHFH